MAATTNRIYIKSHLLVWARPIPNRIKDLFTMVFSNLPELIKYVSEHIAQTDEFHLIIPLVCLKFLLNDPIYQFPQVQHIDVIYDGIKDFK